MATMTLTAKHETRECEVSGKHGIWHGFFQKSWTHGGGLTIGSFHPGQESMPVAVVEMDGGSVEVVDARNVRFTDVPMYKGGE